MSRQCHLLYLNIFKEWELFKIISNLSLLKIFPTKKSLRLNAEFFKKRYKWYYKVYNSKLVLKDCFQRNNSKKICFFKFNIFEVFPKKRMLRKEIKNFQQNFIIKNASLENIFQFRKKKVLFKKNR